MVSAYDPAFDRLVMAQPLVDNANDRVWGPNGQYDGPTCAAEDCASPVDNDGEPCEPCANQPHQYIPSRVPGWCACGRIQSVGGYSPVHGDESDGAA